MSALGEGTGGSEATDDEARRRVEGRAPAASESGRAAARSETCVRVRERRPSAERQPADDDRSGTDEGHKRTRRARLGEGGGVGRGSGGRAATRSAEGGRQARAGKSLTLGPAWQRRRAGDGGRLLQPSLPFLFSPAMAADDDDAIKQAVAAWSTGGRESLCVQPH